MELEFVPLAGESPGIIAALLRESYGSLPADDPRFAGEPARWDAYDREVFARPGTVGACLFLTRVGGRVAGFGSWDPRRRPEYGLVGHHCIVPAFRGLGLGVRQTREIVCRLRRAGARAARATTADHPLFAPARRVSLACGFREVGRFPWPRDPGLTIIEYEQATAPGLDEAAAGAS
jgi:GNAT superfamily N-acetyltransferase